MGRHHMQLMRNALRPLDIDEGVHLGGVTGSCSSRHRAPHSAPMRGSGVRSCDMQSARHETRYYDIQECSAASVKSGLHVAFRRTGHLGNAIVGARRIDRGRPLPTTVETHSRIQMQHLLSRALAALGCGLTGAAPRNTIGGQLADRIRSREEPDVADPPRRLSRATRRAR